jgi:hypothetical protein
MAAWFADLRSTGAICNAPIQIGHFATQYSPYRFRQLLDFVPVIILIGAAGGVLYVDETTFIK